MNLSKLLSSLFLTITISSSLFAKTSLVNAKEESNGKTNYWNEVDINFNSLLSLINKESCSDSVKAFYGCVVAVQTVANHSGKTYEVFPIEAIEGRQVFARVGRLALIEVQKEKINSQQDMIRFIERNRSDIKSRFFSTSLNFVKNPDNEFETLLVFASRQLAKEMTKEQLGFVVAKFLETAVDPHTSLIPKRAFLEISKQESSSFVGIGIEFSMVNGDGVVAAVIENSSAEKAGIQAGDIITKVNEKSIKGMAIDLVLAEIRGNENTKVKLEIIRNKQKIAVEVVRAKIESKVVQAKLLYVDGHKIGYIKLENFMYTKACEEIKAHILNFESQQVAGYSLDLRNNRGGDIAIAQCLGGLFIGKNKVISYFESTVEKIVEYKPQLTTAEKLTNKPLVVLVNSSSASASEIISGALQDHGRALVVGQKTFGKGSYQNCGFAGKKQDLVMCQTGGLFFLPSGRTNQTTGVVPDVEVYFAMNAIDEELAPIREANLYFFPLEPRLMPGSDLSKWASVTVPKACLSSHALEQKFQNASNKEYYAKDFQLLNAVTSVICLSK